MSGWKFGDVLRYPDDQGVGDDILFMFLRAFTHKGETYHNVMVVRTTADDDQWEPGTVVVAGRDELIPYVEPKSIRVFVGGKDVTDEVEVPEIRRAVRDQVRRRGRR